MLTPRFENLDYHLYVSKEHRRWSHRCPQLVALLESLNADVLCCQESATTVPEYSLVPHLQQLGYEAIEPPDQGRAGIERPLTFVRQRRFEVLQVEHRKRASLLVLRAKEAKAAHAGKAGLVFVANVHLQGDPLAIETRRSQLESVCRRLANFRNIYKVGPSNSSVLLCGDFNEPAGTQLHAELRGKEPGFATKHQMWPLEDCYESPTRAPPASFGAAGRADRIDFIYHSQDLVPSAVRWPLAPAEMAKLRWSLARWPPWPEWVPNAWYPSDHFPLAAVFKKRTRKSS